MRIGVDGLMGPPSPVDRGAVIAPASPVLCRGLSSCPVLGITVTEHQPALARIARLEAEREQLLEACLALSARNEDLEKALSLLKAKGR